jgi:hypothetical protein
MRKTTMFASFLALSAGAAGVGAYDAVPEMKGSDTLNQITDALILACPGATGVLYQGTGSGNGQTNITAGAQSIAPMSRALNSSACAGAHAQQADSEGLVFALDGLSLIGETSSACNAAGQGLEINEAATGNDQWRHTLRLIYAGMDLSAGNNILLRDCNSEARQTLVSNWSNIFEGDCTNCTDSQPSYNGANALDRWDTANAIVEPGLRHAFRRDEESGTTDVFLTLLNLPTTNFAVNAPSGITGPTAAAYRRLANSVFCNVRRPTDNVNTIVTGCQDRNPSGTVNAAVSCTGLGPIAEINGSTNTVHMPLTGAGSPRIRTAYFPEFQDQDPIRRECAGRNDGPTAGGDPLNRPAEQVCNRDGMLGLVLPINPPPVDAVQSPTPYPNLPCDPGLFAPAPSLETATGAGLRCPNGDLPVGTDPPKCNVPARLVGGVNNFECLNSRSNRPTLGIADTANSVAIANADGRAYNLQLRRPNGSFATINRPNPDAPTAASIEANIVGAFYRIHSTRSMAATGAGACTRVDATSQLGCLAVASDCSISYAGLEGVTQSAPDAVGLRLNNVLPNTANIQCLVSGGGCTLYPLSRKLYVNSTRGFEDPILAALEPPVGLASGNGALPDSEQELVKCFAAIPDTTVTQFGFIPLPGDPFCEDFNEQTVCGAASNVNACANNPAGIPQ